MTALIAFFLNFPRVGKYRIGIDTAAEDLQEYNQLEFNDVGNLKTW